MDIVTNNSTQEIIEIIISEYEKSQKNIQPEWLGEGWYMRTRNSFNYFASGFEAGMEYSKQQNIGDQLMTKCYQITTVDTLLKWILLILNDNYSIERQDGKIWLYDQNGEGVEYINDPMENK